MDKLQQLLKDLYNISHLSLSIFDLEANLIASYPDGKISFCHMIETCPQACQFCKQKDHDAFKQVKAKPQLFIYECHFHLYEAIVPIYTYEQLSGYLMIGQCLVEDKTSRQLIYDTAKPYFKDLDALKESIEQIPIYTMDHIYAFSRIIETYAHYITLSNALQYNKSDLALMIKNYLVLNYHRDLSIKTLCDHFHVSKATLTTHFKKTYHTSIHQFLLNYRLNKACELLTNSELSIYEIASCCGFVDANYFSKAFKHEYHTSPSEYRKNAA